MMTKNSKNFISAVERLLCSEWESTLTRIESGAVRGSAPKNFLDPAVPLNGWEARDELIKAYLMLKGEMALESSAEEEMASTEGDNVALTTESMPIRPNMGNLQKHVVPFPSKSNVAASARPQPVSLSMSQHGAVARAVSIDERNQPLSVPVEKGVIRKVTDEVPALPIEDERNKPLEVNKQAASIAKVTDSFDKLISEAASKPSVSVSPELNSVAVEKPVVEQPVVEKPAVEKSVVEKPALKAPELKTPALKAPGLKSPVTSKIPTPRRQLPSSLPGAVGSTKISSSSGKVSSKSSSEKTEEPQEKPITKSTADVTNGVQAPESSEEKPEEAKVEGVTYRCEVKPVSDEEVYAQHANLLSGVKYEKHRDFILAEGTNSGTGAPTLVICTLTNDWLEFQFPYEEGQRLLKKYPQRDRELAQLIISKSRVKG